jgi:hypothetical protein
MWRRLLRGGFLLRSLVKELSGIRLQLTRQNDTLDRLVALYAPAALLPQTPPTPQELADTGISYLDAIEAGSVHDYIERTKADTGRAPTDEEILSFLADEKTTSLHARLREREALADLARLGKSG